MQRYIVFGIIFFNQRIIYPKNTQSYLLYIFHIKKNIIPSSGYQIQVTSYMMYEEINNQRLYRLGLNSKKRSRY